MSQTLAPEFTAPFVNREGRRTECTLDLGALCALKYAAHAYVARTAPEGKTVSEVHERAEGAIREFMAVLLNYMSWAGPTHLGLDTDSEGSFGLIGTGGFTFLVLLRRDGIWNKDYGVSAHS